MIAGKLDTRITLLRPEVSEGTLGGECVDYVVAGTARAERKRFSGTTSEQVGELFMTERAVYNIRDAHKVGEHWRVEDTEGVLYDIDLIERNRRRGMITLTCTRVNQ